MKEVLTFYKGLFYRYFGFEPVINYGRDGAVINKLLSENGYGLSIPQLKLFITIHFHWKGMEGDDAFSYKKLRDNCFPISWITTNVNSYMAYSKNVLGINVLDDREIEEYVADFLK